MTNLWRPLLAIGMAAAAGGLAVVAVDSGTTLARIAGFAGFAGGVGAALWILVRQPPASAPAPKPVAASEEPTRLELLGGLAAGLAHELGQPLSVARVGIEGMHYLRQLGREPSPDHLVRTLSRVGLSLMTMTQTIEHLRSLAHPEQGLGPLVAVELGATVDVLLVERQQWMRYADTRIEWVRPAQPVFALADAAGLRLILTNLLRNAVEAVASQSEARRLVRVSVGPGPVVAVHDGGGGMTPDLLAHVFDPFRSTKGAGRGIGLSLAKASAERMGARLQVASTVGAGTVFSLTLLAPRENASGIREVV